MPAVTTPQQATAAERAAALSAPASRSGYPPPREDPIDPRDVGRAATHPGTETPRGSTMYARGGGGRQPVAVDIIGPLPRPGSTGRPASVPPPRRDEGAGPSSDDEYGRLVQEICRVGAVSDQAAQTLLGGGERAVAAVFRSFPGPTTIDRLAAHARLPPLPEIGPLLRVVVMFRQASATHLIERLESTEPEQRYFATLCLGEVVTAAALPQLLARLFDPDFPTRVLAVDVLRAYKRFPEFDQVVRALRAVAADGNAATERRRIAANALGELRDAEGVPALISALAERDPALVSLAHRALVVISRQDHGEEPAAWRAWWDRAAGRSRIEWLIDALLHPEPNLRHDASEELKRLTGQFFGYYFNLPRRERERAYQRYVEWWQAEGRAKFAR
jgi:hypothetical protein